MSRALALCSGFLFACTAASSTGVGGTDGGSSEVVCADGVTISGQGSIPTLGWRQNAEVELHSVAVDGDGNVFVAGELTLAADLGGGLLQGDASGAGSGDAFLVSYTATGEHRWSKRFGGQGYDRIFSLGIDSNGDLYATGEIATSADLGDGVASSGVFVASWNTDGEYRWSTQVDVARAHGLAVAANGTVYLTGEFGVSADLGGESLTSAGYVDAFLASYDQQGAHRWSVAIGGVSNDYGLGVATNGSDGVQVIGSFYDTVSVGTGSLASAGSTDVFVASFDALGVHRWSSSIGLPDTDYPGGIAVSAAGNAYVTGALTPAALDGGTNDDSDFFVSSFDVSGSRSATLEPAAAGFAVGASIAVDPAGNAYAAGRFAESTDFGGGELTASNGTTQAWLASYDGEFAHRWSLQLDWSGPPSGPGGVAIGPNDEVYLIGSFTIQRELAGGMAIERPFLLQFLQESACR